jgi:hypothetical protein
MATSSSGSFTLAAIAKQGVVEAPSSISSVDIVFLLHRPHWLVAEHGLERVEIRFRTQHEDASNFFATQQFLALRGNFWFAWIAAI